MTDKAVSADSIQPTRMRFQDQVRLECTQLVGNLLREVPELAGLAFVYIWDPDMRVEGLDYGLILGRDTQLPRFRLRSAEQTQKLLQFQLQQLHADLRRADQMAQELNKELHDKRQQLDELARQLAAHGAARHPDGPTATDPPQD